MIILLRVWLLRLAFYAFYAFPVRDKIVIASSSSDNLRGNLRYVYDELERRGLTPRVKLLLRRPRSGLLGKLTSLGTGILAEYHLATASVFIVDDYYFPLYVARPKKATTVIQAWHASGAFKKVGYSVAGKEFGASEQLLKRVRIHSNYDYCLIGSKRALPHYMEAFGQPEDKFVSIGFPRTDLFFAEERMTDTVRSLRERYGLPGDKRVVLYAPTFRGTSTRSAEYRDYLDVTDFLRICGDSHVLLLRLHPAVAGGLEIGPTLPGLAVDVSDHDDVNELLLLSDILVTDYSSVIFEYSLLERPMVFFAPDLAEYEAERGFYFDYKQGVPGPVFARTEDVSDYIARGEYDLEAVRELRRESFDVADGRASERFVSQLVLPHLR